MSSAMERHAQSCVCEGSFTVCYRPELVADLALHVGKKRHRHRRERGEAASHPTHFGMLAAGERAALEPEMVSSTRFVRKSAPGRVRANTLDT
jgi:hypothetical protein